VADPKAYVDSFIDYNYNASHVREAFSRLATALIEEGDTERAIEVLDYAIAQLPVNKFRWSLHALPLIQAYYEAGANEKGDSLLENYFATTSQYIAHYLSFPDSKRDLVSYEMENRIREMNQQLRTVEDAGRTALSDSIAMKALEYGLETYQKDNYLFPYYYSYVTYIAAYYESGDTETGDQMLDAYTSIFMSELDYLSSIRDAEPDLADRYIRENTIIMGELLRIAEYHERTETAGEIKAYFGIN
jgi:tetratricopeptide (TPR) repeat protein